jgi:hypothetical protein
MQRPYHEPEIEIKPSKKNKTMGRIIKIMALNLLILSILLMILGLLPQTRDPVSKAFQPVEVATSEGVTLEKGEILVVDYYIEGKDTSFYLTIGQPWQSSGENYLVKREHSVTDHIEYEAQWSGLYYMNFESKDSSSETFQVEMDYKIVTRFTPIYILMGVTALIVGVGLAVFYIWWKKKPHMMEDDYIRL